MSKSLKEIIDGKNVRKMIEAGEPPERVIPAHLIKRKIDPWSRFRALMILTVWFIVAFALGLYAGSYNADVELLKENQKLRVEIDNLRHPIQDTPRPSGPPVFE